jgi:hypothetical protein
MSEIKGARAQRLLDELVEAAKSCGFEVRREKLMREIGYRARGGSCRVRERDLIILDSVQPAAEQLEVLAEALKERNFETLYLSPAARRMIQTEAEQA